ncbi:MAG: hypothetical protein ACRDI2_14930 [Chloroflexota bacterium]
MTTGIASSSSTAATLVPPSRAGKGGEGEQGRGPAPGRGVGLLLAILSVAVAACSLWLVRWWNAPAPVPDHAAPFVATQPMLFAGQTELAQRITPQRDGLTAVDLLISAEERGLPGLIELRIAEWPSRREVRAARRPAADAPAGNPWELRPGQPSERWLAFGFDPIPDSAGRDYLLILTYPEGRDTPGARLGTLAHFPGRYPFGQLEVNGNPANSNLLFRLAAAGTHGQAMLGAADNLARRQPYFPVSLALPAALAGTCLFLAAGLGTAIVRSTSPPTPSPRSGERTRPR